MDEFKKRNTKYYSVVNTELMKVSIPSSSHFSIGTSPYYAHQKAVAIDIYDQITIDNYQVSSPISGKVLQIKELQAPRPRFKGGIDKEYLTIIQNPDDKNTVFKILHIKPYLYVGKKLEVGDPLGETIRNGYFAPWSSPHIHLELKRPDEALRAKGGYNFDLNIKRERTTNISQQMNNYEQIPIKIEFVCEEFILCRFPENFYLYMEPIYGVRGNSGNINYIIDGGIPQYKNGIIHFHTGFDAKNIKTIKFLNVEIGKLMEVRGNYGLVQFFPMKMLLSNYVIRGISLFLANFQPFIKIISYQKENFDFRLGSIQYFKISPT